MSGGDIKSKDCLFLIWKVCSYLCDDGHDAVEKGQLIGVIMYI